MEAIIQNLDIILTAAVVLITAAILARQGQIALLRELILSLIGTRTDKTANTEAVRSRVCEAMPLMCRLLVSEKTVAKLVDEAADSE